MLTNKIFVQSLLKMKEIYTIKKKKVLSGYQGGVGPSFIESKNFAVLNEHVIFPAESILHALDLCYKMIKSLPVITKSWKPRPFGNMIPHVWCILEYVMYDSNENLDLYVPVRDLLTKLNSADAS